MTKIGPHFRKWLLARGIDPELLDRRRLRRLEFEYEDVVLRDDDTLELMSQEPRRPKPRTRRTRL